MIAITHPEKVLFPDDGITKGELARYYEAIASVMVPYVRGRPLTMERYPAGIDKKGFIQKDVVKGFPEWLERVEVPKKGGSVALPTRQRRSLAALDGEPKLHHAARLDVAPSRARASRSLRLRSRSLARRPEGAPRCRARRSRVARRARPSELAQDLGLQRLSHRRAARRRSGVRRRLRVYGRRRCGPGPARSRPPDAGIHQSRPRRIEFSSTRGATASARRSRRPTPFGRRRERRCRRRVRGRSSRAAASDPGRSRSERCRNGLRTWATSGRTCAVTSSRCALRCKRCARN